MRVTGSDSQLVFSNHNPKISARLFQKERGCPPHPAAKEPRSWQAPRARGRPASRLRPLSAQLASHTGPAQAGGTGHTESLLEMGAAFSKHMPSCWGKPSSVLSLSASKRTRRHQGSQAWPPWRVQGTHSRTRGLSYCFWQEEAMSFPT